MSGPDKERSCGGNDGGGGGGDDEDEDGIIGPSKKEGLKEEAAQKCERKSKRASVFRFGKGKKTLQLVQGKVRRTRKKKKKKKGNLVNSGCFGSCVDGDVGCTLCEKQPQTLDSSGESPCSDPNSKEFTYDMLRVFIEKNDFYAAECNPHLDSD